MAEFDPEAYLGVGVGGGFDPDAYVGHAPPPKPEPGLLDRLGLVPKAGALKQGAAVISPQEERLFMAPNVETGMGAFKHPEATLKAAALAAGVPLPEVAGPVLGGAIGGGLGAGALSNFKPVPTAVGALTGGMLPLATSAISKAVGPWLEDVASTRALKSTGDIVKTTLDRLNRESPTRARRVGQAILNEPGVQLRSPEALQNTAEAAQERYLAQMKGAVDAGEKAGATVELAPVSQKLPYDVSDLVSRVRGAMGAPVKNDPLALLESGERTSLSPSEAWSVRKRLDEYLRGVKGTQDPTSTFLKDQVNDLRNGLSDEITKGLGRVGKADPWQAGNAGYSYMTSAADLAKKGASRGTGRMDFGLPEFIAAAPAFGAGFIHGGAPEGALLAATLGLGTKAARTWGNPLLARSTQAAARLLAESPNISPASAPYLARLSQGANLGLLPGVAQENQK